MIKIYLLIIPLFFGSYILSAQGLFESVLSEQPADSKSLTTPVLNGYVRGSAWGGTKDYNYAHVFGEFALQGKMKTKNTFFIGDLRIREG